MAVSTDVVVRFLADTKGVQQSVDEVEGTGSRLKSWALGVGAAIGGAFAAAKVAEFAKDAVNAASDLSESISKTGVVFGTSATDIEAWSKTSATAMGLSQQAALEAAGTYGNLAVAIGLPQDKAADMSKTLVGLAGDLASFNNVPVGDALAALQSGLTGETEPLKKFGVNMNDAALKSEALSLGLVKLSVDTTKVSEQQEKVDKATRATAEALKKYGKDSTQYTDAVRDQEQANAKLAVVMEGKMPQSLDASTKAQAAYSLIMKQTSTAQGDFARTSDGLANQQRIAAAQVENLKASLGEALLPVIQQLVTVLNNYLIPVLQVAGQFIQDNSGWLVPVAGIILGLVAAIKAWEIAQAALNLVMSANPILLVVVAIAALIAGIILAYQNCEVFREIVDAAFRGIVIAFGWIVDAAKAVFDWIRDNWPLLLSILLGPFGIAVGIIIQNWDSIKRAGQDVWQWISGTWTTLTGYLTAPFTAAWGVISGIWQNIKDGASAVYDWVKGKFDSLVGAIEGVLGGVAGAAASVANAIKAPINAIIRGWNGLRLVVPTITLPKVDLGPLGTIGGQSFGGWTFDFPNISELAKGGIVTGPTLAMIGEAGREAVIPLPRGGGLIGGRHTYNLNVNVAPGADPAQVGRTIVGLIQAYERGNGQDWRNRRSA